VIGIHSVILRPDPANAATDIDVTCLLDQVSIHHGRDDTGSQPEASTATLDLSLDSASTELPPAMDVGTLIQVTTRFAGVDYIRFVGRISDVSLGWDDAGADTPNAVVSQVQAASPISELGRRIVGDTPFPQELDGARVARILQLADINLDPNTSDPGRVQILPRDIDAQAALDMAWATANDASGIVWESRAGQVRYADSEHRRNAIPLVTVDACDILVTPTWQRTTEGIINKVAIGYGLVPEGGEQPQWIASRQDSVDRFGRYELSQSTQLAAQADAEAMASMLLTRNHEPVWILESLPLDMRGLDAETTVLILGLDMNDLMSVTGLPTTGAVPSSTSLWVEGWTETLAWGEHELILSVSGYCRTAPAPRWDDVRPTTTWDTATGTWDSWSCQGPQPSEGRWADVPASFRWDALGAAITWDTWPY
jgi:hypothetical protein